MNARSLSTGLAIIGLLGVANASPGSLGSSPLETMKGILSRPTGDQRSREDVVEQLVRMGPGAIPELFHTYTGENIEKLLGSGEFVAERWWCAPDEFGELSLEALGEMPPKPLLSFLKKQTNKDTAVEIRLSAMRVLGELGSAEGLPLLFQTASKEGPKAMRYRSVASTFEDALGEILSSDDQSFAILEGRIDELDAQLLALAIESTRKADRPEGVEFLLSILGRDAALDIAVLEASAELARRFPWRVSTDPRRPIRDRLDAKDPQVRRAAVIATGRIRDTEAFLELIGMLEDPDYNVTRAVTWSLRHMSGQTKLDTVEEWTRWRELEATWWSTEGARLRNELRAEDPRRVTAAANALSQRTFYRDEVVLDICEVLPQQVPVAVTQLCSVLTRLDSSNAVPTLVDLLFDKNARVRNSAGNALKAITGRSLPAEPWIWEKYANG